MNNGYKIGGDSRPGDDPTVVAERDKLSKAIADVIGASPTGPLEAYGHLAALSRANGVMMARIQYLAIQEFNAGNRPMPPNPIQLLQMIAEEVKQEYNRAIVLYVGPSADKPFGEPVEPGEAGSPGSPAATQKT